MNGKDKEIQIGHQNTGMGINYETKLFHSLYGSVAFFLAKYNDYIMEISNIKKSINPILERGGDIIGFNEVLGKEQCYIVQEELEKRGYTVFCEISTEMWSQNNKENNPSNIVGIKDRNAQIIKKTEIKNKRKVEGILISLAYMLQTMKKGQEGIQEGINLYKRLSKGILDGQITSFDLGDFIFSYTHFHSDNPNLLSYFTDHLQNKNPHIIVGDFNMGNLEKLLQTYPFLGKDYQDLSPKERTFPYSKGLEIFSNLFLKIPDKIIGRGVTQNSIEIILGPSDHAGIITKLTID
ncbi:hypothetical protein HGA92_01805 [Candidatus Gracilibacteria bacterium]|nr:hypothetical protein [Candidatus Gracilibacteria bacterium]NUJ99486.1 hypothetical protein [Candidatus Gracilibacteria bacterium]